MTRLMVIFSAWLTVTAKFASTNATKPILDLSSQEGFAENHAEVGQSYSRLLDAVKDLGKIE